MTGIKLCATGSYLPALEVDNHAFANIVETSDEWIRTRSGIRSRHIADGETAWSMGAAAAKSALERAAMTAEQIDMIVVATLSPDYITPSVGCAIQNELGAKNAFCIDINCACSGFVYALDMARRYLACGDVSTVLVVGTEVMSSVIDYTDRSTCVLFGDGAGACIVQAQPQGRYACHLGAQAGGMHLLYGRHKRPASPFSQSSPPLPQGMDGEKDNVLFMDGREVYKFATKAMPEALEACCKKLGIAPKELDWIVPHQANVRIVQTAMKHLGLPMERAWLNIAHCGNTSAASIPIALDELVCSGRLVRGQSLALVAFGAGLSYGGLVFDY